MEHVRKWVTHMAPGDTSRARRARDQVVAKFVGNYKKIQAVGKKKQNVCDLSQVTIDLSALFLYRQDAFPYKVESVATRHLDVLRSRQQ